MFENEYREIFSQVTASDRLYRRIQRMNRNKRWHRRPMSKLALVAAVIAMLVMTVSASELAVGWFRRFFAEKAQEELTPGQVAFIEENEQIIEEGKEENGWTVELRSAISDGTKAYFIIGVTAPENISLEQRIENDSVKDWFGPGNRSAQLDHVVKPSIPSASVEDNYYYGGTYGWRDDGDGKSNTMNMVYELHIGRWRPNEACMLQEPFGKDVDFYIHIENIVREYDDEEYYKELMEGKYAGQTDVMFTPEETQRLQKVDVLVEGVWDFTVNFGKSEAGIELLSQPIRAGAWVWDEEDPNNMFDGKKVKQNVTIQSFILNPFSALIACKEENVSFDEMYAVMNDGTKILLRDNGITVDAQSPIVLEEVDYILLADGTMLPMPE